MKSRVDPPKADLKCASKPRNPKLVSLLILNVIIMITGPGEKVEFNKERLSRKSTFPTMYYEASILRKMMPKSQ